MINYHAELIWIIDAVLAAIAAVLVGITVLYAAVKRISERRRNAHLSNIKRNVHSLAGAEKKFTLPVCPIVMTRNEEEFLDVEMNRESVLFNTSERELIRECFEVPEKVALIKGMAEGSHNKWKRIEALLSLGYIGSPEAMAILERAVFDADADVAYHSILAMSLIKTRGSAAVLLKALDKNIVSRNKIVSLLDDYPPEIAAEAAPYLRSKDHAVRYWAAKLIARLDPAGYAGRITELLSDASPDVRAAACECAGLSGDSALAVRLKESLSDKAWFVRMHAARALANLTDGSAMRDIVPLINDSSIMVRESVKKIMADDIESAIPFMEKILRGEDELARREAAEAIETSGYAVRIIDGLIDDDPAKSSSSAGLVSAILSVPARSGLISALDEFRGDRRRKIIARIGQIDRDFADHLRGIYGGEEAV